MDKNKMISEIYKEIANKENKTRICPYCDEVLWIKNRVLIWDVLDWIDNKKMTDWDKSVNRLNIVAIWKNKRLPIEEQSEETIKYIYNLLTK